MRVGAHHPDREIARQRRGPGEVIDPARLPRGALNPRHPRPAQPRIALHRGRDRRAAFVLGLAEAFRQHRGILDRHARALRGERQHRVRGIAEQRDRAIGPFAAVGHGEQRPFPPVVDRADHHPRRRPAIATTRKHVLDFADVAGRAPARPVPGSRHHRDDIDLPRAGDRIGDQMRVRSHPELDPARGIFARQLRGIERAAPGDQPGELRLHIRKQMMRAPRTRCRRRRSAPAPLPAGASCRCAGPPSAPWHG